jgi:zinc transport system permease protein
MTGCWTANVMGMLTALLAEQEPKHWLDPVIDWITQLFPSWSFFNMPYNVIGFLAVVLASLVCGAVGSLVVGNRMAFFSDALAHCAFAGVSIGFLLALLSGIRNANEFWQTVLPVMIVFGMLVGIGIAWVREKTSLASDTVIGVFFAGSIGLAAMLKKLIRNRQLFNLDDFLFGDPLTANADDLVYLLALVLITAAVLVLMYNRFVFTSFNPSLARSRRIPIRLCSYVFIVLLALIVNVCLKTVGVLLINALLIVPAAAVANVVRNMRQLFWGTVLLCLAVSTSGFWLSQQIGLPDPNDPRHPIQFGSGGTTVVLSVLLFFAAMLAEPLRRRWLRATPLPSPAVESNTKG